MNVDVLDRNLLLALAWWRKLLTVLLWTIATVVGLLMIAINWPLSDGIWWAIAGGVAVVSINMGIQEHQAGVQRRHDSLVRRLDAIDYRIQRLENAINEVPRRTVARANKEPFT